MRLHLLFIFGYLFFLHSSCTKYDTAKPTFFLRSGNIAINTTESKEGTGSHKITDLWLYVDQQFKGAYPVGNLMPIINHDQSVKLSILAGIKNNGISDTRIFYPLYAPLEFDTLIKSGEHISRDLHFNYVSGTTFAWVEGFEGGSAGFGISKSAVSDADFTLAAPSDCFEGKSIQLAIEGNGIIAQIESTGSGFSLPVGNSNVYLELNYKSNHVFEVGLIGEDGTRKPALNINPQTEWNKIYVQLSTAVSTAPTSDKYKVYVRMLKVDVDNPKLFLDNLKLVYL